MCNICIHNILLPVEALAGWYIVCRHFAKAEQSKIKGIQLNQE